MEIINAMGLACPAPVIETKKAIAKLPYAGGIVTVLVDNAVACENLNKMCGQKGYRCDTQKRADKEYAVTITVGAGHGLSMAVAAVGAEAQPNLKTPSLQGDTEYASIISQTNRMAVAIGQDKMGSGDDELGKILIKGFIYSLANLDVPPMALLFFNSGVRLTLQNSNTLDDLKTLAQKGTAILVCGTCVDFYNCKGLVAVGEITNMYNIVEQLRQASSVINI